MEERYMERTNLPNHINGKHIHVFRWLDGCGWTIECGLIHIESSSIIDAVSDFLKVTEGLDVVYEHRGFGLVGEIGAFNKSVEKSYFY